MKVSARSSLEEQTPSSVFANTQFCESFPGSPSLQAELDQDRRMTESRVNFFVAGAATTSARNKMQDNLEQEGGCNERDSLAQESETSSTVYLPRAPVGDSRHLGTGRDDNGRNHEPSNEQGSRNNEASVVSDDSREDFCFPDTGKEEAVMVESALKRIVAALLKDECKTSKALFERVLGFECVPYEESMSASPGATLDPAEILYAYLHNLCMHFAQKRHRQSMQVKQVAECIMQQYHALVDAEKFDDMIEEQTET